MPGSDLFFQCNHKPKSSIYKQCPVTSNTQASNPFNTCSGSTFEPIFQSTLRAPAARKQRAVSCSAGGPCASPGSGEGHGPRARHGAGRLLVPPCWPWRRQGGNPRGRWRPGWVQRGAHGAGEGGGAGGQRLGLDFAKLPLHLSVHGLRNRYLPLTELILA